jgi:putative hemolysin
LPEAILPPKATEEAEKKADTKNGESSGNILGGCVSPDGRLMALCDDRKQVTLWSCNDWRLVHQWALQRRANRVIFNQAPML